MRCMWNSFYFTILFRSSFFWEHFCNDLIKVKVGMFNWILRDKTSYHHIYITSFHFKILIISNLSSVFFTTDPPYGFRPFLLFLRAFLLKQATTHICQPAVVVLSVCFLVVSNCMNSKIWMSCNYKFKILTDTSHINIECILSGFADIEN